MKLAICLCLIAVCASPAFADQSLGTTSINVTDSDQSRPLSLSLWYRGNGGVQEDVGANAVFTGVIAGRDASLIGDRLPMVLLSHGGSRSAGNSGAWLAAALARAGYLAVEINARRVATAADAIDEIWRRPDDVSRALDEISNDPAWSKHIDNNRISVVGFALGGTAALALAGGEFEVQSFIQSCTETNSGPDCAWYQAQNVDLGSVDRDGLVESRRDLRIRSIVAVSPEYLDVFSDGLSSIDVPSLLISLGRDSGVQTSAQANIFAQAVLPDATIFDGFQRCTPAGPKILADEDGDPAICGTSSEARERAHDAIVEEIVTFLAEPHK